MSEDSGYSLRQLYQQLAKKNITVPIVNEYLYSLAELGYCPDPFINRPTKLVPNFIVGVIIAAEQLYLTSDYLRDQSLEVALRSFTDNNPEFRSSVEGPVQKELSIFTYLLTNNEKFVIAVFLGLLFIGCSAGLSLLLFPHNGFLATEGLVGNVSKLYFAR